MQLEHLLRGLEVTVAPFSICEVRRDTGLVLDAAPAATLHYVLRGRGIARCGGGREIALAPHTVLITPSAARLTVVCGRDGRVRFPPPACRPLPGDWTWNRVGDGDPGLVIACAEVNATDGAAIGLFDYLDDIWVERVAGEQAFRGAFETLLTELARPGPGTIALAETLMKQCLIMLLRRAGEPGDRHVPWLSALADPRLAKTVAAMAAQPDQAFSLEILAAIAGMSRATFSDHFKDVFGRPPMAFLKDLRLRRASRLLAATDLPIKMVASRVGFQSRSHFSRAFKAFAGSDPLGFRTRSRVAREAPSPGPTLRGPAADGAASGAPGKRRKSASGR